MEQNPLGSPFTFSKIAEQIGGVFGQTGTSLCFICMRKQRKTTTTTHTHTIWISKWRKYFIITKCKRHGSFRKRSTIPIYSTSCLWTVGPFLQSLIMLRSCVLVSWYVSIGNCSLSLVRVVGELNYHIFSVVCKPLECRAKQIMRARY